ncbi:hypothetical protein PYCCODRAFT_1440082 [Trametes coccinea BRFM310]|uniref:Uncharacterized protein n=1 Tax=Trametes coccinea (strain BRFM310) TaxID=1353009 RepID=A0A1Y2IAU8_TRAC3|nr:hypothetical protein PYCCODRAFT_1440082 [Trametes coccinea BRFM310]
MGGLGFDIWGAVAAAISIVALVPSVAYYLLGGFPTSNFRALEELLNETEKMFQDCIKEGVIHREHDLQGLHAWLWKIKIQTDALRLDVYDIRTWRDELSKWRAGLTCQICVLYRDISRLRLKLATTSSRERRALEATGHTSRLAFLSAVQSRSSHSVSPHTLPPAPLMMFPDSLDAQAAKSSTLEHPVRTDAAPVSDSSETSPPYNASRDGVSNHCGVCSSSLSHLHVHPDSHYVCDCNQVCRGDSLHHLVSDSDLNSLFSMALASPCPRSGFSSSRPQRHKRYRRAVYQELLLQYGRRLFGPDSPTITEKGSTPSRRLLGLRSRLKEISRLMRRYKPDNDLADTLGHHADAFGRYDTRSNESDHGC